MHHLIQQHSKDFSSCNAHDSTATALFTDVHGCICNVLIIRASERADVERWRKKKTATSLSTHTEDGSFSGAALEAWGFCGTALNNSDNAAFMLFGETWIHSQLALIRLMVLWHTKWAHFTLDGVRMKTNTYFNSRQRKAVARVVSIALYGAMRC